MTKYDPRKNAEGYNDPTPYAAEKHMMAQIRGKQARVAGGYFENIISASCDYYLSRGLAKIEKTPEPMKPLGAKNRKGQFLACYTKQAQPDYGGTLKGGRSIYFEAKHTDDERIEQRRLTQEQQDDLEAHHKLGAIAFVLVSMSLTDFYRVPWPVWRDMAEIYGRKYMTHAELSRYEVPATAGFIKFLHGIESISIHALREEGDHTSNAKTPIVYNFYPRPPRGGRRRCSSRSSPPMNFYPRPPRGGRPSSGRNFSFGVLFLSTPSARRATREKSLCMTKLQISIHALREEGDSGVS